MKVMINLLYYIDKSLKTDKSLKHNANLAKSPTRTVKTQSNHIVLSILAFFKLETLKIKHHLNHFALKAKL